MDAKPSKSARKRDHHALQALGERLLVLTEAQLDNMPLDDALRAAIIEARRIKSRSAARRQRQLIGKLMRHVDPEPIRAALGTLARRYAADTLLLHRTEEWRERLIREGSSAVAEFRALTGRRNEALERLIDDLRRSPTAAIERQKRRELFRQVHSDLGSRDTAKVQNSDR